MMIIDQEKCIGCGACVKDCTVRDIVMIDGKAHAKNVNCFKCGHCIAVCPTDAVKMDDYDMDEVVDYSKENFDIKPETLLNFIKFRRSVRQFTTQAVEAEKINQIIEAGRFTQTGINLQDVSYIVIQDGKEIVTCLVIGYPDVIYKRTAPRKKADIIWK